MSPEEGRGSRRHLAAAVTAAARRGGGGGGVGGGGSGGGGSARVCVMTESPGAQRHSSRHIFP